MTTTLAGAGGGRWRAPMVMPPMRQQSLVGALSVGAGVPPWGPGIPPPILCAVSGQLT